MDVIFADKACLIDEHLSETIDLINSKVQNQLTEFEKSISCTLEQLEMNIVSKMQGSVNGVDECRIKSLINEYLSVKEVDLKPLFSCELTKFENETASQMHF